MRRRREDNLEGTDLLNWIEKKSVPTPNGCLEWQGTLNAYGYGCIKSGGRTHLVHRLAYALRSGAYPKGRVVRHKCDNPKCLAVGHLLLGTQSENMRDKVARSRHPRGVDTTYAKLTESDVLAIRAASNCTGKSLAERYGVSPSLISAIILRKKWAHVGVPNRQINQRLAAVGALRSRDEA